MAISTPVDKITPAGNTANASSYTTAAVVLDANKLYIIQVVGYRTTAQAISSIVHDAAGTPLSFSLISDGTDTAAQLAYDVAAHRVHEAWYVIPGSTTASAAITITWASAQSAAGWRLVEIASGFDATGGATTFPGVAKATGNSTAPAVTMASFGATDNLTLLLVAWGSGTSNPTQTISPTESRTELSEHNDGERSSCGLHYQNPNGGDTSIGCTLSATNNWGAIGIEVAAAASSITVTPGLGQATWDGLALTVGLPLTVTPGLGQATWDGLAPTISTGGGSVTVTPGLGQATWSGFAPTIGLPVTVVPGLGQATWTGFAPTLGLPITVLPGVGAATWDGFAATLGLPLTVSPALGQATWDGYFPTQVGTPSGAPTAMLRFFYDP